MENGWTICFLAISVAFFCGCGDGARQGPEAQVPVEGTQPSSVPVEAAPTSPVPDEVAMAEAEIERDFSTLPYVVTNNWSGADAVAHQISDKIVKLPPVLSEQYGRKMAQTIMSVPIGHLSRSDRFRTLVAMFHMLTENVGWRDMKQENLWELRIMSLTRYREEIEYAKREGKDDRRTSSYVEFLSDNINGYSEFWEKELAFRVSKSIPPQDYAWMVKEVPEEEYAAIRKRFEEFLGRPIRSYEEIRRVQDERIKQSKRARESRATDSDVKVDVGDL